MGTCISDDRTVDKTITDIGAEVTAQIKADTSIIDPVFVVSGDVSTFGTCNYVKTKNLGGRHYYVRDIKTVGNGMTELHCHCDVLSTVATPLRTLDAVIERQENEFNLYLDDGSFKVYAKPYVITKNFPNGFESPCFILGLWGAKSTTP